MYNPIKIRHFRKVDPASWNKFVMQSESAWVYHVWEWQDLMSKTWDGRNLSFAVGEDGKMTGILPAFQMAANSILIDSGFGPGGFAYRGRHDKIEILKIILSSIRNLYWNVYSVNVYDKFFRIILQSLSTKMEEDYRQYMASGLFGDCSTQTVHIDIAGKSSDDLLLEYSTTTRQNIKTAIKKGLICNELDLNQSSFEIYYKMHYDTYTRTGVRPHPPEYFKNMYELMKPYYRLFVAFNVIGKPVSAINVAYMRGKALYSTGASSEDGLKLNASKVVQHHAMSILAKDGISTYEMGEVHPEAKPDDGKLYGLTRFKMSFGGKIVPFRKVICRISDILGEKS